MAARGGGRAQFKNALTTGIIILVIGAVLLGWMRINNISSMFGVYTYFKAWADEVRECGGVNGPNFFKWRCEYSQSPGSGEDPGSSTNPPAETPLAPEWYPGIPVFEYQDPTEEFLEALETIEIAEPSEIEYNRAEWKHWTGEPCDTRRLVLERDGEDVELVENDGYCFTEGGTWVSPYDNEEHTESIALDIDHVIPLYYAAQHGGQEWKPERKEKFANDTNFLLAVTAAENRSKGAAGPSEYLPPERDWHCSYAKVWVAGLIYYELTTTEEDKAELKDALQKC